MTEPGPPATTPEPAPPIVDGFVPKAHLSPEPVPQLYLYHPGHTPPRDDVDARDEIERLRAERGAYARLAYAWADTDLRRAQFAGCSGDPLPAPPEPAPPSLADLAAAAPVTGEYAARLPGVAVEIDPLDETAEERRERLAELDDECEFCTCSHTEHAGWCCVHNPGPAPAAATPALHLPQHVSAEPLVRRCTECGERWPCPTAAGPVPVADDLSARLARHRIVHDETGRLSPWCRFDGQVWPCDASLAEAAIDRLRSELVSERTLHQAYKTNHRTVCAERDAERARVSALTTAIEAQRPVIEAAERWAISREQCNSVDPRIACYPEAVDGLALAVIAWRAAVSPTPEPEVNDG